MTGGLCISCEGKFEHHHSGSAGEVLELVIDRAAIQEALLLNSSGPPDHARRASPRAKL